jgi:hypothetical protein
MKPHPLAHLIPDSNQFSLPSLRGTPELLANAVEMIYSNGSFSGCFLSDSGDWQGRIGRYDRDEFMDTADGPRFFSEIYDSLPVGSEDACHVYTGLAFDQWKQQGKGSETPYSIFQDSGICVDSSNVEMKWGLLGYLTSRSGGRFALPYGPAHYAYAERGSCGQGWTLGACATVNQRVAICPAMLIEVGGNRLDFDGENKHEKTVTSTWCRSGIPSWLKAWTLKEFPWAPGAITRFDGGLDALWRLVGEGGQLHHGANATAGNSQPDTWRRIGGHAQATFGGDRSERTLKWFADKGYRLTTPRDFWVATHQTWGNWSGQTAASFWPAWWGKQPQGAWVSRASSLLSRVRDCYAYLPRMTWFPGSPTPPPPGDITPLTGKLRAQQGPITGTLMAGETEYFLAPIGDGEFTPVRKGI